MRCRYFLRVPNFSDRSEKFDAQWRSLGGHDVICPFGAENRSAIRAVCQPTTIGDFGFDCRHCFDEQTAPCRLILMQASWSRTMQSLWYQSLCRCVFFVIALRRRLKKRSGLFFVSCWKSKCSGNEFRFRVRFAGLSGVRRAGQAVPSDGRGARRGHQRRRLRLLRLGHGHGALPEGNDRRLRRPLPTRILARPVGTASLSFFFASYYFASPPQRNFYSFVLLFTFYSRSPNYSRYEPCVIS